MYLQRLELKNTGPIEHAKVECRFNADGSPKPIVFVGQNGSGKSVATAHVVSALIDAHGTIFEDSDVEKGKVYKLRSPTYIRRGAEYSTGEVHFSNNFSVSEAQFLKPKNQYVEPYPEYSEWNAVKLSETSHYASNFADGVDEVKDSLNRTTHIFFPPNRFEEPAWLNELNLRNRTSYASMKSYDTFSNRPVVNYAPMRDLQSWLLDLVYDCNAVERRSELCFPPHFGGVPEAPQIVEKHDGPASRILEPIAVFLRTLFGKHGPVSWSIGARNRRQIGISINNEPVTSNLFQLSTGQAVLLDLFLAIIRDFDLSHSQLTQLSDIEGIVVVDEIDLHLHTDLQHDLLPSLIRLFPKVQFILTTHSPLFLIGMEKTFTSDGFQLIELPDGQEIEVERFSEFEAAYKHMQDSARFQSELRAHILAAQKPILVVEDKHDAIYKIAFLKTQGVAIENGNYSDLFDEHAPFEIRRAESAGSVAGFLGMNNTDGYDGKKVIGLFDFDKEGTECFYHLKKKKNWDANMSGDAKSGVFKKRNQHDCFYSLLLPVPDRHKELISSVKNGKFGSYVEIENLLPDEFLTEHDLVDIEQITGSLWYTKIKNDSKSTMAGLLVSANAKVFEDFKPLFAKIVELFDI